MSHPVWRLSLVGATLALSCDPALARERVVLQFDLEGIASTTSLAWRDGDDVLVDADVFDALGMKTPRGDGPFSLRKAPGARFSIDDTTGAVDLSCTAACFAAYELGGALRDFPGGGEDISGLVVNYDVSALGVGSDWRAGGVFGAVAARGAVSFDASVLAETGAGFTRLDSGVTLDSAMWRVRARLGDAISRAGAWGLPARFGGVKIGTDFSLDPSFITFPTPTLRAAAGLPSTVDVYVNGALRETKAAEPGPFTITDAPYVTGAGVARVVVTDLLGREQVTSQNFYVAPRLLKSGLADFSVDLGAERLGYGFDDRYGEMFGAVTYRAGVAPGLTIEARGEGRRGGAVGGVAVAGAHYFLGEGEISLAHSRFERGGDLARVTWSKQAGSFSFGASAEATSASFARVGQARDIAPDRFRQSASIGWTGRLGGFTAGHVATDARSGPSSAAWNAGYNREFRRGVLSVTGLALTRPRSAYIVSLAFVTRFGRNGSTATSADARRDGARYALRAGSTPPEGGGFGWRAGASGGDLARYDAAATYSGAHGDFSAEASRVFGKTGLRASARGAVIFTGGEVYAAREVRDAYALVQAAPGAVISLDNRYAGRVNKNGRLLLPGLRAYQANRLSVDVDAAPMTMRIGADAMVVKAKARAGVRATFDMAREEGRWVKIAGPDGAPIAQGTLLMRVGDDALFFVGAGGLAYLSRTADHSHFKAKIAGSACVIDMDGGDRLVCEAIR